MSSVDNASPPDIIWKVTESLEADYAVNVLWDGCLVVVVFFVFVFTWIYWMQQNLHGMWDFSHGHLQF